MNENISRPSGAKPPPIGRGLAGKPSALRKLRNESTVALWGFGERKTTSPNLVTFVVPPPERTISSASFTYLSWHNPIFQTRGDGDALFDARRACWISTEQLIIVGVHFGHRCPREHHTSSISIRRGLGGRAATGHCTSAQHGLKLFDRGPLSRLTLTRQVRSPARYLLLDLKFED